MNAQTNPMQARGLRPASELASNRPHGDRLRYVGGCRCDQCRRANSEYERERNLARKAGDWNGIVPITKARKHLDWLSKQGIGRRAVAAVSDVGETVLMDIRRGSKKHIRALTERRILAVTVDAASDHALIDARPTWQLLDALIDAGYTKSQLARELGRKTPALQIGKGKVTVRNAYDVKRMHERLINSDECPVDAELARSKIRALRIELISAQQIAREIGLDGAIENGEIRLPRKIPRRIEKQVLAMFQRYQA
jgi:hypothetical protein